MLTRMNFWSTQYKRKRRIRLTRLSLSFLYLLISLPGAVRSPPLFSPLLQCINTSEIHKEALGAAPACRCIGQRPEAAMLTAQRGCRPSLGCYSTRELPRSLPHCLCPETKPLQGHHTVYLLVLTPKWSTLFPFQTQVREFNDISPSRQPHLILLIYFLQINPSLWGQQVGIFTKSGTTADHPINLLECHITKRLGS